MRSGGFFVGAVGGLALALLVVGVASFLPQTNSPLNTTSTPQGSAQSVTTAVLATSTTTNGSAEFIAGVAGEQIAGVSAPAASSNTTTPPVGAGAASVQSGLTATGGTQGQQRPSSLLAVLPGESVGSLIATVSPLLVGLLVAALVYGAYVRRQDSAS